MISFMIYFIERDLDEEGRIKFRHSLDTAGTQKPKKTKAPNTTTYIPASKERWRAPEGWTPPGWNEERSYANAKSFMGFQANPK